MLCFVASFVLLMKGSVWILRERERERIFGFWMALAESKLESRRFLKGEQHPSTGGQNSCFQPQKVWLSH
jgi:hypothetical protein